MSVPERSNIGKEDPTVNWIEISPLNGRLSPFKPDFPVSPSFRVTVEGLD